MTIIRAELQTTDFLFLCRSSLLLSEICQNIQIFSFIRSSYFPKFDAQIAANSVYGSLYFKNFPGGDSPDPLGSLTPSALVCMTIHTTLASPLEIINSSFRESRLPPSWKEADIVPVPKQRIVKDVSEHLRPISLTPILSKVAEEFIIYKNMSNRLF